MEFYGEDDIGKIFINFVEVGDSVVIRPNMSEFRKQAEIEILPKILSMALVDWMNKHPHYRVRETLSILQGGYTITIHVWFDRHGSTG